MPRRKTVLLTVRSGAVHTDLDYLNESFFQELRPYEVETHMRPLIRDRRIVIEHREDISAIDVHGGRGNVHDRATDDVPGLPDLVGGAARDQVRIDVVI